jgi:hypothetical protein
MTNETHLKILRILDSNPKMTQRELSIALGVSLGKVNFCLGFVYYESINRGLKRRLIYEYRCDERLKTKNEESTRLSD